MKTRSIKSLRALSASLALCLAACGGEEPGPKSQEGKGDLLWDQPGGTDCGEGLFADHKCNQDVGHVCRPESAIDDNRCGQPNPFGGLCHEDADCQTGLCYDERCTVYQNHIVPLPVPRDHPDYLVCIVQVRGSWFWCPLGQAQNTPSGDRCQCSENTQMIRGVASPSHLHR